MRVSRIKNIDTDRLARRQQFLVGMMENANKHFENRRPFVEKAIELYAIENALEERGHTFDRKTLPNTHSPEPKRRITT